MKILLIEDDEKIALFIVKGMKAAGCTVDHVTDGRDGLSLASSQPYDAAIIDIMLPGLDGLSVVEEMRKHRIATPVIILSARGSVDDRVKGLQTGADDYLSKPFAFTELLARVQALVRRMSGVTEPTRFTAGDLSINLVTREVKRGDETIELQPMEFSLLEYLMRNTGRVVSRTMIMEHVWSYDFDPGTNVVDARICRLRDKIDRDHPHKLIHTVRGVGYVLKDQP